jgi:AraC family transcriptional regulator
MQTLPERAVRSVKMRGDHSAQVGDLIRRAMASFETDRTAASRYLNDASALLGTRSVEPRDYSPGTPNAPQRGGLANYQAHRALEYIEAKLESKIEIGTLAGSIGLSKSHFSRAFKRSIGFSPTAYISTRRVVRAQLMMTSTGERLADIALVCGFADQSHFNRCFRDLVGISPGIWRRTFAAPKQGRARCSLDLTRATLLPM